MKKSVRTICGDNVYHSPDTQYGDNKLPPKNVQGEIVAIPHAILVLRRSRTMHPMLVQLLQDLLNLGEHLGHANHAQGVCDPKEKVRELQDGRASRPWDENLRTLRATNF